MINGNNRCFIVWIILHARRCIIGVFHFPKETRVICFPHLTALRYTDRKGFLWPLFLSSFSYFIPRILIIGYVLLNWSINDSNKEMTSLDLRLVVNQAGEIR